MKTQKKKRKPTKKYWKVGIDQYGFAILIDDCKWNKFYHFPARFQYVLLSGGIAMCPACHGTRVPKAIREAFDVTNRILDEE